MEKRSIKVSNTNKYQWFKKISKPTAVAILIISIMVSTIVVSGIAVAAGEPVVTITNQPNNLTNDTSATFTFTADPSADTFSCRLDAGTWDPCTSPQELVGLTEGLHTFEVYGTNVNGDGAVESVAWEIDLTPPDTYIWAQPSDPSTDSTPTFGFYSNDGNATLECSIDGGAYSACTSPYTTSPLPIGLHDFEVRATDLAGNIDSSQALYSWEIIEPDDRVITDCEELQDIDNSPSTIGGTYTLANDIDCSMTNPDSPNYDIGGTWSDGDGFVPIGTTFDDFAGQFDGGGFTISDLYINRPTSSDIGLFGASSSESTIHDLTLDDPVIRGGYDVGSLVGDNESDITDVTVNNLDLVADDNEDTVGGLTGISYGVTLLRVHVNGTVYAPDYDEVGGLTGYLDSSTASYTSFQGDVLADYEVGGLVGEIEDDDSRIDHSYTTGTVTAEDSNAGGLLGEAEADGIVIDQSYSTSDVYNDSYDNGGLVGYGYSDMTVTNSYARGDVVGSDNDAGGFIGDTYSTNIVENSYSTGAVDDGSSDYGGFAGDSAEATFTNNFWDKQTSGQEFGCNVDQVCGGISGEITSQMKISQTFIDADWDFDTIWAQNSAVNDGYPCLQWQEGCVGYTNTSGQNDADNDGIADGTEQAGPNFGDANGDSVDDFEQDNVTSFLNLISGKYTSIQTACGQDIPDNSNVSAMAESAEYKDAGYSYPAGLANFTFNCSGTATITQFFYGDFDLDTITPRKYNSVTKTYTTISEAIMTKEVIGGEKVLKIDYSIADNGPLDENSEVGTITDPSGPGLSAVGAPNTGLGKL